MHKITVDSLGNLGNRMFQYAFASKLKLLIENSEIIGANLPEWNIPLGEPPTENFDNEIALNDFVEINIPGLQHFIKQHRSVAIRLHGYFLNASLLPPREFASTRIFPSAGTPTRLFADKELLINIRAGDILSGDYSFYPLLPIAFYRFLVESTGLTPVFVGQVNDPGPYIDELRRNFPKSEFIGTGNPLADFEMVRSAKHVCLAVSTFSWLAAWLSDAVTIYYPLLGFLHPKLQPCYGPNLAPTNLAVTDDPRFRFFLFPLTYALPERDALQYHAKINGMWREISAAQVDHIRANAPFIRCGAPTLQPNPIWYAHTFPTAALEIAEGWYLDPAHHYFDVGHLRGFGPPPDKSQ